MTVDESNTFGKGGGSLAANQEVSTLADSLFDFDPTIDPNKTPAENAAAIGANVGTNLGTQCGQVTVSGAGVTVAFGAPPGCTLASGPAISGSVSVAVSRSGSTTTIALTLDDVVVNGEAIAGTASFATTNGSTFAVTTNLTSGDKTDAADLTVVGAPGSLTISGTSQVTEAGVKSALTFTNVVHEEGECYATSGSMTVTTVGITETITFNAGTPATGEVTVTIGKRTSTATLLPYGSCPSDGGRDAGGPG